ncbi:MAG: hypothetical protein IRY85_08625 [Micromonosporaceae bacterium]|nr:hypothetical protein [Micromonosporaceae bacterium]
MTSLAVDRRAILASRALAVTRLQLTTNLLPLAIPLVVLAGSFVVNVMVFSASDRAQAEGTTGGVASIYFAQLVVAWASVHQNFSFTVGLNATRGAYYLGSLAVAVLQSLVYGLVLFVLNILELATGDWGIGLAFFDPAGLTPDASPATYLVYTVPLAFVTMLGLFLGSVSKRFGTRGFFLLSIAAFLVGGLVATLITHLNGWEPIVEWLARQSLRAVLTGWLLVPTVLASVGGWFVLRRAVP